MAFGKKKVPCPTCKEAEVLRHCPNNARCTWLKCQGAACGVTIGLRWTGSRWESRRSFRPPENEGER